MRVRHLVPLAVSLGLTLLVDAPASALVSDTLSISVPGPKDLGTVSPGQTLNVALGPVTVSGGVLDKQGWTATVALSAPFTVTQSGKSWTLPSTRVSYWSGLAAGSLLTLGITCTAGQATALTAQGLSSARTAYSCPAIATSLTLGWALQWTPTLVITTLTTDPAGTYTGTITHSVL